MTVSLKQRSTQTPLSPNFTEYSDSYHLAREACLQVNGTATGHSAPLDIVAQAIDRASRTPGFAGLSPERKLSAAVRLTRQIKQYQQMVTVITGAMRNVSTITHQLVANATTGEDILNLALTAHLPGIRSTPYRDDDDALHYDIPLSNLN